jgi:GST-like protein
VIKFYFHHTPNSMKVALMLEEAELPYEVVPVDIYKGEQHLAAYRATNPNGKVPALADGSVVVFDSNAILLYLAEKTGRFLGSPPDRAQVLSWLMFVASGIGPYSGQAVHFRRVHADSAYATNRYRREVERHYDVLDGRLADAAFIGGGEYTIADMAAWGWIRIAGFVLGTDRALDATPRLKRWFEQVDARPAAARAREVGREIAFKKDDLDDAARLALYPQNFAPAA